MVKWILSSTFLISSSYCFAQLKLSQKEVAEMVLKQNRDVQVVNLNSELSKTDLTRARSNFDWKLDASTSFLDDQAESISNTELEKSETLQNSVSVKKSLPTGTSITAELSRNSNRRTVEPSTETSYTSDSAGIKVSQSLLKNSFGSKDRSLLRAAEKDFDSSQLLRADRLQDLVLDGIRKFWEAYVSQETFQESLNSRERYKQLVAAVRKKASYGYTSPGELSQVEAEYEVREQNVKTESAKYLAAIDGLKTFLNVGKDQEIELIVSRDIPNLPKLANVDLEQLRLVKSKRLGLEASDEKISAAKSDTLPELALEGRVYRTGLDNNPEGSFSELSSGTRPQYYVGLSLSHQFGSGIQRQDLESKKISKNVATIELQKSLAELADKENDIKRRSQAAYALAVSTKEQIRLREKALQELTRSYNQGRTDISIFIEAMNRYFNAQISHISALGNYNIVLNEWAAFRDELISESGTKAQGVQ